MPQPVLDLIFSRRSIRKFTHQPVERETLTALLQAAMAAPSASNSRPWEFAVLTEPERLDALRSALPLGRYHAPAALVVCANPLIAANPSGWLFWQQDCAAAVENVLIAAAGMGLGAVWIGVYPLRPLVWAVRRVIQAPVWVTPMCALWVGYPAHIKPPRTQYEERRVHWERY
jgi:nitroreductase